ncbi:hypothetical protein GALL_536730 [mine drainage metagenome]|uniref:Penicillin-binding C-terminal domain-containing protein n=1 Tax=mine drainage metagenome TaxID=410659 RepID=A0A1J5P102_9ZZZZ
MDVCLASGALPTVWCPRRGKSWFIPGISPIKVDTVYRPVWVDKTTQKAVCPPFDSTRDERKVFEFWPSDLQQVFAAAGLARAKPPQAANCQFNGNLVAGMTPKITSPLIGSVYTLQLSDPNQSRIALTADTDADVRAIYWFAARSYLGQSEVGQPLFWTPDQPGTYALRDVDDHGRSDSREIRVAAVP